MIGGVVVHAHRFRNLVETWRLPQVPAPRASHTGFMACPAALVLNPFFIQSLWQRQVYERAFREAQAVVRPSILERDLLGVWN
jgi:hypothetical protein